MAHFTLIAFTINFMHNLNIDLLRTPGVFFVDNLVTIVIIINNSHAIVPPPKLYVVIFTQFYNEYHSNIGLVCEYIVRHNDGCYSCSFV